MNAFLHEILEFEFSIKFFPIRKRRKKKRTNQLKSIIKNSMESSVQIVHLFILHFGNR